MRSMFGLVGLLVTIGVIAWIMSEAYLPHTQAVINAQKSMQPTINRVTSQGDDGRPSSSSAVLLPVETNGRLRGLSVQSVVTGGAMDKTYGLLPGDVILQIQGFAIGDSFSAVVQDESSAKDFLFVDAYRGHWPITVNRGGTQITLPAQRGFLPPNAGKSSGSAAVSSPAPTATPSVPVSPKGPPAPDSAADSAADLIKRLQNQ